MEKVSANEFPRISDLSRVIEDTLQSIFQENYPKYVIKHSDRRFIVLPPRYLHLPPILISIQEHPEASGRALFLTLSRRIPIDSQEDIKNILNEINSMIHVDIETIYRPWEKRDKKDTKPIRYLLLSSRIHALAVRDKTWLLLALSSMIRLDEKFMIGDEKTIEKTKKSFPPTEYT